MSSFTNFRLETSSHWGDVKKISRCRFKLKIIKKVVNAEERFIKL